jgi:hypothetical protein
VNVKSGARQRGRFHEYVGSKEPPNNPLETDAAMSPGRSPLTLALMGACLLAPQLHRHDESRMARPFPGAPDRRQAYRPPDSQVAEGWSV